MNLHITKTSNNTDVRICAIVVTYQPDLRILHEVIKATLLQVDGLVVVDNGSRNDVSILKSETEYAFLGLGENLGIAAGFNRGIEWAKANGFSHVLLLDQDSIPKPDMVTQLSLAYDKLIQQGIKVAAVGPRYYDPDTGHSSVFARLGALVFRFITCDCEESVVPAAFLISAGSLTAIETFSQVGNMDEKLFIDLVDTEWFLRAASNGYNAFGVCPAVMHHSIGDSSIRIPFVRKEGRYVPAHSPLRHYYFFRNSMLLCRRHYIPLRWVINNCVQLLYMLCFFPVVTPPRLKHLSMMLKGAFDGLRGRSGRADGAHP